jgi:hypothetical protein
MNKKELWLRLAHYHFDHLVPAHLWDFISAKFGGQHPYLKAFADKLCRKLNWEREFALRAIWEYKKFVYLGVVSDFSVTPSKIIDQVWHEHILFSNGYRLFCDEIIEYTFDHHPELVPMDAQSEAFQTQYYLTLELYKTEFGAFPPEEIWGITKFETPKNTKREKIQTQKNDSATSDYTGTDPLISNFDSNNGDIFEFGSGEFSGGGASDDWSSESDNGDSGDGDSGGDGGGCSSGCGGGCGS